MTRQQMLTLSIQLLQKTMRRIPIPQKNTTPLLPLNTQTHLLENIVPHFAVNYLTANHSILSPATKKQTNHNTALIHPEIRS
jgi:hypothetical protein